MARALAGLIALALCGRAGADVLEHQEQRLANGLRVLYLVDRRAPQVAVVTWYGVGSGDETAGKTGLAHLFEHLMFKGSPHAADGVMDRLIEEAGGWTNADTGTDRTLYVDLATAGFLERALWLEADRMAGLPAALDQAKLDNQRDVVLNERREAHENRPYGMAEILINEALWPAGHPYHAPVIGYVDDLRAATVDDARGFFRTWYVPANATLVVAGDLDVAAARRWVESDFGWIPGGAAPARPAAAAAPLGRQVDLSAEDDVQVPRVYVTWRGARAFSSDEAALELAAAMLAGGKSGKLYQTLVVQQRLAQDVFAGHDGGERGGEFQVVVTAKPGVAPARLVAAVDAELARLGDAADLERAKNTREARFLAGLADLPARAEQLARYAVDQGAPLRSAPRSAEPSGAPAADSGFLEKDLARYRAVTSADVRDVVGRYLRPEARVVLTIAPRRAHAP